MHLAYQLLDGYRSVVLVDAVARGGAPGTLHLIEAPPPGTAGPGEALVDGHRMTPDTVLALLDTLSAGTGSPKPSRVLIVGCEPAVPGGGHRSERSRGRRRGRGRAAGAEGRRRGVRPARAPAHGGLTGPPRPPKRSNEQKGVPPPCGRSP